MRLYTKSMIVLWVLMFGVFSTGVAQPDIPSENDQIGAATSAAPESMQKEATVMGYNKSGDLVMLREGSNPLICLADDPGQANFHVSCYHKDLEPFMALGRKLRDKGFSRNKVDSIRRAEIKAGTLKMPRKPMALYSLSGSSGAYDYEMNEVKDARPLYVVYVPYATQASTGLATRPPSKGAPWIMEPGTPWAHIMVMTGRSMGRDIKKEKKF